MAASSQSLTYPLPCSRALLEPRHASSASRTQFARDRAARVSEHSTPQLREHLRHLAQQIITVGATKLVHAGAVPAPVLIVVEDTRFGKVDRLHFGSEVGIEEEGKRQAVAAGAVAYAMWRRTIQAAGHAIEHVSDVADEGAGHWRRVDPARLQPYLQTAGLVLF